MLNIEKTVLPSPEQWEIILEGMRNPKNSWDRMDSYFLYTDPYNGEPAYGYSIGENDYHLMETLADGGPVHAKYRRMIPVYITMTAPLYFWKEFDTYKVGTVANSCSTMHKIHAKEFELGDFSYEHLLGSSLGVADSVEVLEDIICTMNYYRAMFLETKDKKYWWQMIQLLPTSYNQKRTIMLNYEVLTNIYHSRKNHKLDEWHTFCDWIKMLPYSELITGEEHGE